MNVPIPDELLSFLNFRNDFDIDNNFYGICQSYINQTTKELIDVNDIKYFERAFVIRKSAQIAHSLQITTEQLQLETFNAKMQEVYNLLINTPIYHAFFD